LERASALSSFSKLSCMEGFGKEADMRCGPTIYVVEAEDAERMVSQVMGVSTVLDEACDACVRIAKECVAKEWSNVTWEEMRCTYRDTAHVLTIEDGYWHEFRVVRYEDGVFPAPE
jgi:hypothetical protein